MSFPGFPDYERDTLSTTAMFHRQCSNISPQIKFPDDSCVTIPDENLSPVHPLNTYHRSGSCGGNNPASSGRFLYIRSLFARRSFSENRKESETNLGCVEGVLSNFNFQSDNKSVKRNSSACSRRRSACTVRDVRNNSSDIKVSRTFTAVTTVDPDEISRASEMSIETAHHLSSVPSLTAQKSTVTRGILATAGFVWVPMLCTPPRQRNSVTNSPDVRLEEARCHGRWSTRRNAIYGHIEQPLPQETRERLEKEVAVRKASVKRKVSQYIKSIYSNDYEVDLS